MHKHKFYLFVILLSCLPVIAQAVDQSTTDQSREIETKLGELFPRLGQVEIQKTDIPGVYQFWVGATLNHVRLQDGHILLGELYDTERKVSLAEEAKDGKVKEIVDGIDESKMIIYQGKESKRTINVFTDVNCHFCRKMHTEIQELTNAGVTVRYIAFPAFSRDIPKHVSVWCSDNQQEAMTKAKAGQSIPENQCQTPVEETLNIGFELGFRGTPQIVYDTGQIIGGYRPAQQIIRDLNLGG
ncbi:MAG: DsbC family protein [Arenicella sp.]